MQKAAYTLSASPASCSPASPRWSAPPSPRAAASMPHAQGCSGSSGCKGCKEAQAAEAARGGQHTASATAACMQHHCCTVQNMQLHPTSPLTLPLSKLQAWLEGCKVCKEAQAANAARCCQTCKHGCSCQVCNARPLFTPCQQRSPAIHFFPSETARQLQGSRPAVPLQLQGSSPLENNGRPAGSTTAPTCAWHPAAQRLQAAPAPAPAP